VSADGRRATGALGERLAEEWLVADGYRVLERNARTRAGEIDLVAIGKGCLVFCEVRARVGARASVGVDGAGGPLESIGPQKRRRLRLLAREWLTAHAGAEMRGVDRVRFDAIGVVVAGDGTLLELEHIEDAF
jgi:putative endonuclease